MIATERELQFDFRRIDSQTKFSSQNKENI